MVQTGLRRIPVLVTGASGFVGDAFCRRANALGWPIRTSSREVQLQYGENVRISTINGETDWGVALKNVEVVIHLAARVHVMKDTSTNPLAEFRKVNVEGTEKLARQAAMAGVKRLVYVSSIKVNGESTDFRDPYSEQDAPSPQDPYGVSKCEAEQALHRVARETGLEVVIVRPPLVYGAGVKGNFIQMLKVLARGAILPLASVKNARSMIYVDNLVDALMVCAAHPAAVGQTYLVSDGQDVSTPELLRALATGMGVRERLVPCPPAMMKMAARMVGKGAQANRLLGSLQIDSGKIRRELNWTPPYSLMQGLQQTAAWYRTTHL